MTQDESLAMLQFLRRGGAVRMLLKKDVSSELDTLFRYARQLSSAGDHRAAANLLRLLTAYDDWSFDYWYQLGATCHAAHAWSDALYAYGRAAKINVSAAQVPCAAGECFLACGEKALARKAFKAALLICGENRSLQAIRRQAEQGLSRTGESDG
ncbi:CesD/SycD/LcrH family type III secretion system chaperone SscA [Symbiopectobacterium purcellii]|uniref:CesD/SycD/LcrH family type III secretion system chaperone SscA n=1 Tax=Symbiopectobacterium purcellii TaxID=2871826 RepID=UPI003F8432C9